MHNISQHGETCIRNLDLKGFDTSICHLESLQLIQLVTEDIGILIEERTGEMFARIDGLPRELDAALERLEFRSVDKIFNGLKRGLELTTLAGKELDKEYENLQLSLELYLRTLCASIQRSLDVYEIREAHRNLERFRSLLVAEAVRGTEYNNDRLGKFQSEMDEIKQEILTPRLLTEDPERINLCLEGFKEVDHRSVSDSLYGRKHLLPCHLLLCCWSHQSTVLCGTQIMPGV